MRLRHHGQKRGHGWHYDRCANCDRKLTENEPVEYDSRVYEFQVDFIAFCEKCKNKYKEV